MRMIYLVEPVEKTGSFVKWMRIQEAKKSRSQE